LSVFNFKASAVCRKLLCEKAGSRKEAVGRPYSCDATRNGYFDKGPETMIDLGCRDPDTGPSMKTKPNCRVPQTVACRDLSVVTYLRKRMNYPVQAQAPRSPLSENTCTVAVILVMARW